MRLTRERGVEVLRRAVALGVNFVDTADVYGPETSELLIAEALHPYPDGLGIAKDPVYEVRWLLERSPVMLPIPGTSSVEHLELNLRAAA